MLREDRLSEITNLVREKGRVVTTELMEKYDMSEGSIRRDLNELQDQGVLKKVFGGAVALNSPKEIQKTWSSESEKLADSVYMTYSHVKRLFIDFSETNLALASKLNKDQIVYTNSVSVLEVLKDTPAEVHLLGGELDSTLMITKGYDLINRLEQTKFDVAVIGVTAFHPVFGITTDEEDVALYQHTITKGPSKIICMVDSNQIPKQKMYSVARPESLDQIYFLDTLSEQYKSLMKNSPFHVQIVSS